MPDDADTSHRVNQEQCSPGYFCASGLRRLCDAGYFGDADGESVSTCSGPCSPGYYCNSGSNSSTQYECGNVAVYCPTGSPAPVYATPGELTVGPSLATRNATVHCPAGYYCVGGIDIECPAGRFGCATGLKTDECNGPCAAGSYCPLASTSNKMFSCGNASVYCPEGSASPVPVDVGHYSYGGLVVYQASAQASCPNGSYCVDGIKAPCPAGRYGNRIELSSADCSGVCSDGYECAAGSTSSVAAHCQAGYNCTGGKKVVCAAGRYSLTGSTTCTACVAGRFSALPAAPSQDYCLPCAHVDGALIQEGSEEGAARCWPGLLYANASNPLPLIVGFSVGDIITMSFTKSTNTPAVPVAFEPSIGGISFTWLSQGTTLVVHVNDAGGVAQPIDPKSVDIGRLTFTLQGIRAVDGSSALEMPSFPLLVDGTWGEPSMPVIANVVACNSGGEVGFGVGDSVAIVFDQDVNRPDVSYAAAVRAVVTFTPSSIDSVVSSGYWFDRRTLIVVFGDPAAANLVNDSNILVGRLAVAVLTTGNIRSENNETLPSNATARMLSGSWGDVPVVRLVDKSSTSLRVLLGTPANAISYTAQRFWLQWSNELSFNDTAVPSSWAAVVNSSYLRQSTAAVVTTADGTVSSTTVVVDYIPWAVAMTQAEGGQGDPLTPSTASDTGVAESPMTVVVTLQRSFDLAVGFTISFDLEHLTPQVTYFVRAGCNNDGFGNDDVIGPVTQSVPIGLAPQPPAIVSLTTASPVLLCVGGQTIVIIGFRLGRVGDVAKLTLINQRRMRFHSAACAYVTDLTILSCVSPSGVGGNLTAIVTVDGVPSDEFDGFMLSYSVPSVTSMSGPAAVHGATVGGTITIHGINFGSTALNAVDMVWYAPVNLPYRYTARCVVTVDDIEITCDTPEGGVGGRVLWTVVVGGLESVNPRTTYRQPVIMDVSITPSQREGFNDTELLVGQAPDAASLRQLFTDGSQALVFRGDFFGSKTLLVDVIATGTGLSDRDRRIMLTSVCNIIVDQILIACPVPVGVGHDYEWTVAVASQVSTTAPNRTSYAPPTISVVGVDTSGVRVTFSTAQEPQLEVGSSDPLQVPTDGSAVMTLEGTNFGIDSKALSVRWSGAAVLDAAITIPHTLITFYSVAGAGGSCTLELSVGGQSASALTVQYAAPSIHYLSIPLDVNGSSTINCNAAPDPTVVVAIMIHGANFGNGSATRLVMNGADVTDSVDWSLTTHSLLVFFTPICRGTLSVSVANRLSGNIPYEYSSLVAEPAVSTIDPGHGPAAGGTAVTITGLSFQLEGTVEFVRPDTLQVLGVCLWRGKAGMSYDLEVIKCLTPPGVGIGIAVQITVNGVVSMSAALWRYDAPVIHATAPLSLQPQGGEVFTIEGLNFGTIAASDGLRLVTIGGRPCSQEASLAATASLMNSSAHRWVWNDTTIACMSPVGVLPAVPLVVSMYNQVNAPAVVHYYEPTIAAMMPPLLSTAGGDTLSVVGSNFSVIAPATVIVTLVRLSTQLSGNNRLPCDIVHATTTVIECVTRSGSGMGWRALVTNIDHNGTASQASLISAAAVSYRAPSITSIEYDPTRAPAVGGFWIRITGTDFSQAPTVRVTGLPCSLVAGLLVPHYEVTCIAPPYVVGAASTVTVSADGQSTVGNDIQYNDPFVTAVFPAELDARASPSRGSVSVFGYNFGLPVIDGVSGSIPVNHTIVVGGVRCLGVVWTSDTELECTSPLPTFVVGAVDVRVIVAATESKVNASVTVLFECAPGYYGSDGEYCSSCPVGAGCEGKCRTGLAESKSQLPLALVA